TPRPYRLDCIVIQPPAKPVNQAHVARDTVSIHFSRQEDCAGYMRRQRLLRVLALHDMDGYRWFALTTSADRQDRRKLQENSQTHNVRKPHGHVSSRPS